MLVVLGVVGVWLPRTALWAELCERWDFYSDGFDRVDNSTVSAYFYDSCTPSGAKHSTQKSAAPPVSCHCIAVFPDLAHEPVGESAGPWKDLLRMPEAVKLMIISSFKDSSITPRAKAEKVREILDPTCQQWLVLGHGSGGGIAQWLALEWPNGVNRMVLLNPVTDLKGDRLSALQAQALVLWGQKGVEGPQKAAFELRDAMPQRTLWRELPYCSPAAQKDCFSEVLQAVIDMTRFGAI